MNFVFLIKHIIKQMLTDVGVGLNLVSVCFQLVAGRYVSVVNVIPGCVVSYID